MLKKTILCSSLVFSAFNPSFAKEREGLKAQMRNITPDSRVHFKISLHDLNRIEVKNDRIAQVFGKSGAFLVEQDLENGQLYLKPTPQNGRRPLSVTLTTEKGQVQDLLLTPYDVPGETLILKEDQTSVLKRVLKIMKEEDKDFLEEEGVRGVKRLVPKNTLESDLTQTGIVLLEKREKDSVAYIVEPIDQRAPIFQTKELLQEGSGSLGDQENREKPLTNAKTDSFKTGIQEDEEELLDQEEETVQLEDRKLKTPFSNEETRTSFPIPENDPALPSNQIDSTGVLQQSSLPGESS